MSDKQAAKKTMSNIDDVYKVIKAKRDNVSELYYSVSVDDLLYAEYRSQYFREMTILDDILYMMTNRRYLQEKAAIYDIYIEKE